MDILIHIGVHKTATTFIQNLLWVEREMLLQHGILYPKAGILFNGHHRLGGSLINEMDANVLKRIEQPRFALIAEIPCWQELVAEVDEHRPERLLISSEEFEWYARPAELADHFGTIFPDATVRVAICLRRQDDYLESLYQEFVRSPGLRSKRTFHEVFADPSIADYFKLIDRWAQAFGVNALKLATFEDFRQQGVLNAYINFLELPVAMMPRMHKHAAGARVRERESLPAVCIEFLRLCNQVPISRERHQRIVQALYDIASSLIERHGPACKRILGPKARAELLERFAVVNESIRARFFPGRATLFPHLPADEPVPPVLHVSDIIPLLLRQGLIAP